MVKIVKPKVEILDYGPAIRDKKGKVVVTPDQIVYGGALNTYKDVSAMQELMQTIKEDSTIEEKIANKVTSIAARGHASMATTPIVWFTVSNSSKLVDSIFTGAKFSSSLMPSSRRVPIAKENIVIPKGIKNKGKEQEKIYNQAAKKNIETYEIVQERGVSKQEASKIVHYGHSGGGLFQMPLETIVYFKNLIDSDFENAIPEEGKDIILQLDSWIRKKSGMERIYLGKKRAPRTGCINPNIFTFRRNQAQKLIEEGRLGLEPILLNKYVEPNPSRDYRINSWLKKREEIFSDPEKIKTQGDKLLPELYEIISDYNDSFLFQVASRIPWRVWGEVKRHRTMPQTTESVYNAVDRALKVVNDSELNNSEVDAESLIKAYSPILDLPIPVQRNEENLELWINTADNSFKSYENLVKSGVLKSDAITCIIRGINLGNIKIYDLYNSTIGYSSLRLCATAETKMRATTFAEMELIKSNLDNDYLKELIGSKCEYVGYCPEMQTCGHLQQDFIPFYTEDLHKQIHKNKMKKILKEMV